jgi:hypothetical protein
MIMTLIYPNIVPENDLRLPDALTVKHGPVRLLSRFVLEGDKAARGWVFVCGCGMTSASCSI